MNCKDNDVSQFVNTLLKKYFINYAKVLEFLRKQISFLSLIDFWGRHQLISSYFVYQPKLNS